MNDTLKFTTNPQQSLLLDETLLKFRGGVSGGGSAWWSDNFQECLENHPTVKEAYETTKVQPEQGVPMTTYPHDWTNELNINPEEFRKVMNKINNAEPVDEPCKGNFKKKVISGHVYPHWFKGKF